MSDAEAQAAAAQTASGDDARGVALFAGDWRLALPVGELRAIRQPLPVARVPGSRPWVVGAANGRGRLLPVVDLLAYVRGGAPEPVATTRQWLEIEHDGRLAAIQVEALSRLRRFDWTSGGAGAATLPPRLAACVSGTARDDEGEWLRLSAAALWARPDFADLAATSGVPAC